MLEENTLCLKCITYPKWFICGASSDDKSGTILKLGGTFDLTINWNSGLSIGVYASVDQWIQISALYL